MRFFSLFITSILLIAFQLSGCHSALMLRSTPLEQELEPLKFKPPSPVEWSLNNGLTVMYLENAELPLVSGAIYFRGGSFWEPEDQVGIVSLMGGQLRDGGAGDLSASALDRELERLAATISSSFGDEYGKVGFQSLDSDLDRVFGIFADVVQRPRFEVQRIELAKGIAIDQIKRRSDQASTVAGIGFDQLLYGDTPYGRSSQSDDIRSLNRAKVLATYGRFVHPAEAILVLTGRLSIDKAHQLVDKYFADWNPKSGPLGPPPPLNYSPSPGIYLVNLPFEQSTVYIGQQGVARQTPDQYAIEVFNDIFGSSGFSARLTKKIRVELGLTYGIYGAIQPGLIRGNNVIGLQTKSLSTTNAIVESIKILDQMRPTNVTSQELRQSKLASQNSFVFKFDSSAEVLEKKAFKKMLNYPPNFHDTYISNILKVSADDVRKVASDRWDPSKLIILVVGNEQAIRQVQTMMSSPPDVLKGYPVRVLRFTEKLIW